MKLAMFSAHNELPLIPVCHDSLFLHTAPFLFLHDFIQSVHIPASLAIHPFYVYLVNELMKDQCQDFSIYCCRNIQLICNYTSEMTFYPLPSLFKRKKISTCDWNIQIWMYHIKETQTCTSKPYSSWWFWRISFGIFIFTFCYVLPNLFLSMTLVTWQQYSFFLNLSKYI